MTIPKRSDNDIERAAVIKDEADAERAFQKTQAQTAAPVVPVLFGNENYVSDHKGKESRGLGKHTQEEWLAEATPAMACLDSGDHVSPRLIEDLFHDAFHVIEGFTPPAARARKNDDKREG